MPANTRSVTRPGPFGNPARVVIDKMVGTGEEDGDGNEILVGPWACLISRKGAHPAGWWFATREEAAAKAVEYFRWLVTDAPAAPGWRDRIAELRGSNIACACELDASCHGDVVLELANAPPGGG